jgi:hypothetical protein
LAEINPGVFFEIRVDGKVRSYRDLRDNAIEGAHYLKRKAPSAKVEVRDTRDGSVTVIGEMQSDHGMQKAARHRPRGS